MTLFAENAKDNKCICESFIEKNKIVFDLEKENAKLKETVACLREDIDVKRKDIDWYKKRGAELDSMLTDKIREVRKAKEIIKELLDFDFLPENEIKKQAEQFLEEVKE